MPSIISKFTSLVSRKKITTDAIEDVLNNETNLIDNSTKQLIRYKLTFIKNFSINFLDEKKYNNYKIYDIIEFIVIAIKNLNDNFNKIKENKKFICPEIMKSLITDMIELLLHIINNSNILYIHNSIFNKKFIKELYTLNNSIIELNNSINTYFNIFLLY